MSSLSEPRRIRSNRKSIIPFTNSRDFLKRRVAVDSEVPPVSDVIEADLAV